MSNIISSTAFVRWTYQGSSRRGLVKVIDIPHGYKSRAVEAVEKTPRLATSGGWRSADVAAALAGVGLQEVELYHTRRFTLVKWTKNGVKNNE